MGHIVWDHRFWVEGQDSVGGRTRVARYAADIGGPGAVAAVTIEALGGHAMLVSRVGGDQNGQAAIQQLQLSGVDSHLVERHDSATTAVSAVIVGPDGDRHIYPYPGTYPPSEPVAMQIDELGVPRAILVDSRWPARALTYAKAAHEAGIPVIVDLDVDQEAMWQVVREASYTICDEDLARLLGGPAALMERINRLGSWSAVTLGKRGMITQSTAIPAFDVNAVDTTGAGDVFHGAFALAIAERKAIGPALRFASAAAAVKCAAGRIPTRFEAEALLAEPA